MRFTSALLVALLFPIFAFTQSNKEIFGLKSQIGLTEKNEAIVQMTPVENGNKFLLVGRNQLQLWDVPSAKLVSSSPHKITGFWDGGFLMRLVSFPHKINPIHFNFNQMRVSSDAAFGITISKPNDRTKIKDKTKAGIVWDLRTGESLGSLTRGVGPVRDAQFSEDGSTIITTHGELKDTELAFWDARTLSHRTSIEVKNLSFQHLSRDGASVFIASAKANKWLGVMVVDYEPSNGIELRNTRTGKLEKSYTDGSAVFLSTTHVSPDERYVVARTTDGKIVVWETSGDGTPKYRIEQPASRISDGLVGISNDSRYLLTATKNEAKVYDLGSGNLYRQFPLKQEHYYALSPDSRLAIIKGDGWVSVLDLEKDKIASHYVLRKEVQQNENEANTEREVEKPTISPDGKFMMIDSYKDVRIYDVMTGALVQTLFDPERVKYKKNGELKDSGLDHGGAGWLASGNSIYVSSADGRSFYLWNKK